MMQLTRFELDRRAIGEQARVTGNCGYWSLLTGEIVPHDVQHGMCVRCTRLMR